MNFQKDTVMTWKSTGKPAYQKVDNDEWGNWRSLEYDLDKPLMDRFGFKWTDEQVYEWYKGFMNFKPPN